MKYIFLDIDGVLNSDLYMSSATYLAEVTALGLEPKGTEVVNKAHHLHLDPAAIKLLNSLVEKSGAKVIISSTWRKKYSLSELRTMLQGRGATFEIHGVTPAKMSWRPRGLDISAFLYNANKTDGVPEAFVILDDVDEFSKFQDQFVQTSENTGLTQKEVGRALKILGVEDGSK